MSWTPAWLDWGREDADLSVGDGDDVGGNVGGHVPSLRLDDGKRRQGAAPEVIVHLGGSFQETGMQVEDVPGVGLAAGGATQQEGHLPVGHGLRTQERSTLARRDNRDNRDR